MIRLWLLILLKTVSRYRVAFFLGLLGLTIISFAQIKYRLYNTNSITIGLVGTFQEHDLPEEVTGLLSRGLVKEDSSGRITGKLVSGWETNNDATQFRFKLKDNLKWSDNTEIKSKDLVFAIPDVEVSFPDEKNIQFNLKEAYSPLPGLLTKPILKKNTLLGTGPYRIKKIEKSRIFITKIILFSPDPKLPMVTIRFYPSEKTAITGFNLGEVQVLMGLVNTKAFVNNPRIFLKQKTDYSKIVTVLLNTKDTNLANRSFRQALSFAAPKIAGEMEANNPYPPFLWAYNADSKKYLSNTKEAKNALERAKSNLPEETLTDELILTATPNLEDVGNKTVSAWKDLGLNARQRIESGIPQNFQALLITQSIPIDPDQYFLWHATQTKTNLTRYDSKRADKDLEDGRKLIPEEDRKAKYFDFQRTLLEDAPAIFLYFPKYNIVYLKKSEKLLNKILSL